MKNDNKQNKQKEDDVRLHLTDNSTLQTREEKESDNAVDPRNDRTISVSEDDLHDPQEDRLPSGESAEEREADQ